MKGGMSQAAVIQILCERGLSLENATKLAGRVKVEVLRYRLPGELQRSGRRHLFIGGLAFLVSILLLVFAILLATEQPRNQEWDLGIPDRLKIPCLLVGLSLADIAYALLQLRRSKELQEKQESEKPAGS